MSAMLLCIYTTALQTCLYVVVLLGKYTTATAFLCTFVGLTLADRQHHQQQQKRTSAGALVFVEEIAILTATGERPAVAAL